MIGDGRYVEQDYKEAVKWYRKAAENGNAVAQRRLAAAYYEGRGVPQDHKEAARRYRIVAEQGNVEAQAEIGLMYEQGQGVPQDYVSAHIWFNISGANGYETGRKLRDLVAEKMTPAQLAEAQRLAREWMEKHGK